MAHSVDTVVLLTTWNRPSLLRQSLPQIEREAARIGARLVIVDDRSSDEDTLRLLDRARANGAELLVSPGRRQTDPHLDRLVHAPARQVLRTLALSQEGTELISRCALRGGDTAELQRDLWALLNDRLHKTFRSTQNNNLFGFRHVLANYAQARWILKVDDDVVLRGGAFELMLSTWLTAQRAGHDVLAVSGIRTVNELLMRDLGSYGITAGVCSVAVLYRRADWARLLMTIPERRIRANGFDLAFAHDYAPRYRPGAVPICVIPSAVFHTGRNGLNVRDTDVNCDYAGDTANITVA